MYLDGEHIEVRAQVHALGGYSAHAAAKNLIDVVCRMRCKPAEIRPVPGEPVAREALSVALAEQLPEVAVIRQVQGPWSKA